MKRAIVTWMLILLVVVFIVMTPIKTPSTNASAVITPFYDQIDEFNAAANSPPVVVNFDNLAPNTDITNVTINGVTFSTNLATSAPLIVVRANDTYSDTDYSPAAGSGNKLFATSGENILSPGGVELAPGPNVTLEKDDLTLTFVNPVSAVGFDALFQSYDGYSFTSVKVLDAADNVLYQIDQIPMTKTLTNTGGAVFVGFVSNSSDIAKVVIQDLDNNNDNPDNNIGFDTIRVQGIAANPTPETTATPAATPTPSTSSGFPTEYVYAVVVVVLIVAIVLFWLIYSRRKRNGSAK